MIFSNDLKFYHVSLGAWAKLFESEDVFLMSGPQELAWHRIEPQHLSGLSSIFFPSYENL